MKYTAYLFDFDYTLTDSSAGIVLCFRIILERLHYTDITDDAIRRTIGMTLEEAFALLTGEQNADILSAWRQEYTREADQYMNINTHLFPDSLPTLEQLKANGAKIGIVSTKYRRRITDFFKNKTTPDFIDLIIGGEDVCHAKPHPEGILTAIRRLEIEPSSLLYVGDSTIDARAAQAAGVDFAGVLTGTTSCEELKAYPHVRIMHSLNELLSL